MRIYIDTSVINGLYAQYISNIVSDEIKRTPDAHKLGVNVVNKASLYDEIDICSPEEVD